MKRSTALISALLLTLSIAGCKDNDTRPEDPSETYTSADQTINEASSDSLITEQLTEAITKNETELVSENITESTTEPQNDTVTVSHEADVVNGGKTFTDAAPLEQIQYTVTDPENDRGLSEEKVSFSFGYAANGKPHDITVINQQNFDSYATNALAWDNKSPIEEKVLYLTFDCGYVYGNLTSQILDTLKEKDVTAAFFCQLGYIKNSPETVTRMIEEGHIVGNHSTTHPDSSTLSREELAWELLGVDNYLRANFGYENKYFRFPSGIYTQDNLELADSLGYRSVFWSIAHADWDPENQPGVEVSFETVTSRLHPGAVILLHSTSPDNVEILGRFIDYARAQGYEFRSLDSYAYWND